MKRHDERNREVSELTSTLQQISEQLENIKSQSDERGESMTGAQFTCFASTQVRTLTPEELSASAAAPLVILSLLALLYLLY